MIGIGRGLERALLAALCGTSMSLVGSPVGAQAGSEGKAAAEALFDAGLAALKVGDDATACEKFEQSQAIEAGVGTLLYLGECYARTGRAASAWATFREAASLADESNQAERAAIARKRASELEPKLAHLSVQIAPEAKGLAGLRVRRDNEELSVGLFDASLPVDPGKVHIEVSAPGYLSQSLEVDVLPEQSQSVAIPMLEPAPAPPPSSDSDASAGQQAPLAPAGSAPSSGPGATDPASTDTLRWVGLSGVGLGIVGVAVGSYYGLSAISQNSDAESSSCDESLCQLKSDYDKVNSARSDAVVSNVAFVAGGALLAGGLLLYWLAPEVQEKGWSVNAAPTMTGFGVSVGKSL